jgi:hypothetical protein
MSERAVGVMYAGAPAARGRATSSSEREHSLIDCVNSREPEMKRAGRPCPLIDITEYTVY